MGVATSGLRPDEAKPFPQSGYVDASPASGGQLRAPRRESPVYYLDSLGLEKLGYRHEVAIGRDQNCDIVVVNPGKADHVRCHADIDALLLGAAHIGTASRTFGHCRMAGGARGRRTPPLTRNDRHAHAGKCVHHSRRPSVKFPVCFAGRVVGTVEIQPLKFTCGGGVNDCRRGARKYRSKPRPVCAERLVCIPHGESEIPEINEHPHAMAGPWSWLVIGHLGIHKTQGRARRPWGDDNRTPCLPVWAVVRWVMLKQTYAHRIGSAS